jgi:glycerol-3-phosphate dehydrogenase (NAD(P)+)
MRIRGAKIGVLGCGRWGTFIAWYLDRIGNYVTIWGRERSKNMSRLIDKRKNSFIQFSEEVEITTSFCEVMDNEYIFIAINSQGVRDFISQYQSELEGKKIICCMKGLERESGKRISEIFAEKLTEAKVAFLAGPGHVSDLVRYVTTYMEINSVDKDFSEEISRLFSSSFLKCLCGNDLIGAEIGAAAKNVLGIAAGIFNVLGVESLKGLLMVFGARETSDLIEACGGKRESAYGLCHLGDFQATLFSKESNNYRFGKNLCTKTNTIFACEGVWVSSAIKALCNKHGLNLRIYEAIDKVINKISDPKELLELF